jgi:hypothetical protein
MGTGQILSDTFRMVKERFGALLGLWAVYFGITMALFVVLGIGMGAAGLAGLATAGEGDALAQGNLLAAGAGMVVVIVLFYVGYILVALAQYASMIIMASPVARPNFADALGAGARAAPALLLLFLVLLLGYLAVAIVLSLVGAALASLGNAGTAIFVLLLLPVLVWLGCRLSPLFGVVAVDGVRNPFDAIGRSWRLTRGHALAIFLAWLVFAVIIAVILAAALLPSIGVLRSLYDPAAPADAGAALGGIGLLFLGIMVASVLINMLYCAFLAVIHGTLANATGEGVVEAFE